MWRKFRKHRLAMLGGAVTILIYVVVLFAEFLAPFQSDAFSSQFTYAPPQPLHFFDRTEEGLRFSPYVNGYAVEIDQVALRRTFVVDKEQKVPVRLFVHGSPYKLWGLFEADLHLIGPAEYDGDPNRILSPLYLLGADRVGRDVLSRIIYGARISMTIGLIGVAVSFVIGLSLGGLSGFYGGSGGQYHSAGDRDAEIDSNDSSVDGSGCRTAFILDTAPGFLRHHCSPVTGWLDRVSPCSARSLSLLAHRGFRHVCTSGWQQHRSVRSLFICSPLLPATLLPHLPWRSRV